jgi:hypothetical protein
MKDHGPSVKLRQPPASPGEEFTHMQIKSLAQERRRSLMKAVLVTIISALAVLFIPAAAAAVWQAHGFPASRP